MSVNSFVWVKKTQVFLKTQPGGFWVLSGFCGFFISMFSARVYSHQMNVIDTHKTKMTGLLCGEKKTINVKKLQFIHKLTEVTHLKLVNYIVNDGLVYAMPNMQKTLLQLLV